MTSHRILAQALRAARWPAGGRVIDLADHVLEQVVLTALPRVIVLPSTARIRAKRPVRRRVRT